MSPVAFPSEMDLAAPREQLFTNCYTKSPLAVMKSSRLHFFRTVKTKCVTYTFVEVEGKKNKAISLMMSCGKKLIASHIPVAEPAAG